MPYTIHPDQHRPRRPVHAGVPRDLAQQQDPGDRRSRGPGRQADLDLRVRRHPEISRREVRPLLRLPAGASGSRSTSGCSGRSAASARCSGRTTISPATRRRRSPTPSSATSTRRTGCSACSTPSWGGRPLPARLYVAGDDVSIADFAIFDWSNGYANWTIDEAEFPKWHAWRARMRARPATARALAFTLPEKPVDIANDETAQKVLFGQR